jgi:D-alanyl-lipoteichoic acid acyltransferase DltB (MBOAT superfamily)
MLLGGLWHGANWTFVVWGGLHGAALAVHKIFLDRFAPRPAIARLRAGLGWRVFAGLSTFLFVCLCFVLFRTTTFGQAIDFFGGLFSPQAGRRLVDLGAVVPLVVFATATLLDARFRFATLYPRVPWPLRAVGYAAAALVLLLLTPTTQVPFVYFQF